MEDVVFVYIFRVISFAGHLNEYSQFARLLQLIHCFLFVNVKESLDTWMQNALSFSSFIHECIPGFFIFFLVFVLYDAFVHSFT